MKKKQNQINYRTLFLWVAFGLGVAFSGTILFFWITQDIARPIPMAIFIGALVAIASMLFTDKMRVEQSKPGRR